jgi:hypothetical protein
MSHFRQAFMTRLSGPVLDLGQAGPDGAQPAPQWLTDRARDRRTALGVRRHG